ncbi:NALCN channel auxiliary factor 2-like [Salvelinus fontinalis]|uniref:NALCN channel auxiliary factor 2-like n=1 Tax=Salvelinus fontinalis TaxID=8038 RepID=UPI0024862B4D|nr:NALCN channel auxiliary factor 2-like [Salvelinus fontinalis]
MIRGAWMFRREDDAVLKICCAPKQNDKPCADSERVQKWRMSLASLLFFTVLLSDHLWLCAGVKLRSKDRSNRKIWSNATDGVHPALNEEKIGIFLSNFTKSAAPSPHCTDSHSHHTHLESACTTLYQQKNGFGSSFSTPSTFSSQMLLDYFRNFSLSFCDSYTISDLLLGMSSPDSLNCSLQNMVLDLFRGGGDDEDVCSICIQAYMRLDQHAQEKYEEFDFFFLKYLSEDYSVRSHTEDCKSVYKAWLCSEYFNATQSQCQHRIPCKQYCLEVQTMCPFVLPDNDDLVYGGLSSFICTGLLENHLTNADPECCDVRWSGCDPSVGAACALTQLPGSSSWQRRSSPPVSAASRLCSSRLRLCVLVLILLHTVVSFSTVQSSGAVGLEAMVPLPLEESSAREE